MIPLLVSLAMSAACGREHRRDVVRIGVNDLAQPHWGATEIYPLTLYSKKHKTVAEVPRGGEITLSNNPANQVRPLLSRAAAGLIVLKNGASWDSKIEDVDKGASKVRLTTSTPH